MLIRLENCYSHLKISSKLKTKLMKDNNKKLLETIFKKHLKFFDNEFIMNLLVHYKNKLPILNQNLYKKKLIIININYQQN